MDDIHFKILQFLDNQTEPISEERFPNIITSHYPHSMTSEGGLIYDLRIVLSKTKDWITATKYHPNFYIITDFGKSALKKEIDKRAINDDKERLQQDQITSIIDTNKSVASTNYWVKRTSIISVVVASITGFYIIKQSIKDYGKNPSHTDTLLQKTLLLLDSMKQFQKGIDSSLQIMASEDSSKKK